MKINLRRVNGKDREMSPYKKRPEIFDAVQWFKQGDPPFYSTLSGESRPYVLKPYPWDVKCDNCGKHMSNHGILLTGSQSVCPGDWIVTNNLGESYPCRPNVFEKIYEKISDNPHA